MLSLHLFFIKDQIKTNKKKKRRNGGFLPSFVWFPLSIPVFFFGDAMHSVFDSMVSMYFGIHKNTWWKCKRNVNCGTREIDCMSKKPQKNPLDFLLSIFLSKICVRNLTYRIFFLVYFIHSSWVLSSFFNKFLLTISILSIQTFRYLLEKI